jgi:hypothetical protein
MRVTSWARAAAAQISRFLPAQEVKLRHTPDDNPAKCGGLRLRPELVHKSKEEVQAIQAELAALDADIAALRGSASSVGVISSELDRVLDALERERRLLAAVVAAELRAAQSDGRYKSHDPAR